MLYEIKHPETRREATLKVGNSPFRRNGETGKADRFTADHAEETGKSERIIQKLVSIGSQTAVARFEIQAQKSPGRCGAFEFFSLGRTQYFATTGPPNL
jgi:hypothetical protein